VSVANNGIDTILAHTIDHLTPQLFCVSSGDDDDDDGDWQQQRQEQEKRQTKRLWLCFKTITGVCVRVHGIN
jgi:hypothetical protein